MQATAAVPRVAPVHAAAIGFGLVALAARPVATWSIWVTVGVGMIGLLLPAAEARPRPSTALPALAVGLAAFAVVRWSGGGPGVLELSAAPIVAALAEEAFFRRGLFAATERLGALPAIVVTSFLFGLVHVPAYGVAALPIDVAAGALLSWQRHATGSFAVPALTHAVANVLASS